MDKTARQVCQIGFGGGGGLGGVKRGYDRDNLEEEGKEEGEEEEEIGETGLRFEKVEEAMSQNSM